MPNTALKPAVVARIGLYAALSLLLCRQYLDATQFLPDSIIADQAHFAVAWPFKARFLTPWLLDKFLPADLLEEYSFRLAFCSALTFLCFLLIGRFAQRVGIEAAGHVRLAVCLFAVMLAHYGIGRWYNHFQIYDFPAIAAYTFVFILLTSGRRTFLAAGSLAAVIASLNRETILIALFHAGVMRLGSPPTQLGPRLTQWPVAMIGGTGLVIMVVRAIVVRRLGGHAADLYSLYEGDTFRLLANVRHVLFEPPATLNVLLFGCGMILWLPGFGHRLNPPVRCLMLASILPFCGLIVVGNFTELRIFNEFVPLLTVALYQAIGRTR